MSGGPVRFGSGRRAMVVVVILVTAVAGCSSKSSPGASTTPPSSTPPSSIPPSSTSPATTTIPPSTTPPPSSATSGVPLIDQGYVPLYPFSTLAAAQAWERSYRSGGHQPWHLDRGLVALSFVGYLGFTEIDRVTSTRNRSDGAHVGVGYRNPAGRTATAAVLHLMRFGTGALAPWEIVGSDDTTLTLDTPAYAAHVTSPMRVGGRITGVDENLSISVRQLGRVSPLGPIVRTPAGGVRTPWSVTVTFANARPGAMTVVASTGGHVQRVERFAVTGVYA